MDTRPCLAGCGGTMPIADWFVEVHGRRIGSDLSPCTTCGYDPIRGIAADQRKT